ncbi:hypothetical protein HK100_010320, partial [Physocladia obscura]
MTTALSSADAWQFTTDDEEFETTVLLATATPITSLTVTTTAARMVTSDPAIITSRTSPPNMMPNTPSNNGDTLPQEANDPTSSTALIAGIVTGAVAIVVLGVFAVVARARRKSPKFEPVTVIVTTAADVEIYPSRFPSLTRPERR